MIRKILEELVDNIEKDSVKYKRFVLDTHYLAQAEAEIKKYFLEMLPKEIGGMSNDTDEETIEQMGMGISELKAIGYNACLSEIKSKLEG
jgi:hypothetical protein